MSTVPRSKVERLARMLHRGAIALLVVFLIAAGAGIAWVHDEFQGDADFWRYITAVADAGTFLIAAVVAWVGSALVQAIGRIRSSIIGAMMEQREPREIPDPVSW